MTTDTFPVRAVIIVLGLAGLIVVCGEVFLASTGTTIPDSLDRLGIFALGAIAGILSSTRGAAPVEVVNDPANPVPVEGDVGATDLEAAAFVALVSFVFVGLLFLIH